MMKMSNKMTSNDENVEQNDVKCCKMPNKMMSNDENVKQNDIK